MVGTENGSAHGSVYRPADVLDLLGYTLCWRCRSTHMGCTAGHVMCESTSKTFVGYALSVSVASKTRYSILSYTVWYPPFNRGIESVTVPAALVLVGVKRSKVLPF